MNIFQLSISTIVFASTLLLGTTAVIASRFVITTVTGLTKPASVVSKDVVVPTPKSIAELPDLRNETPVHEDFDPTGVYALDIGKVPIAFADMELVQIATREYEQKDGTYSARPIVPAGTLEIVNKSFSLTKISIGNREMSFETATHDGVSYQFVGFFPSVSESIKCEGCENPADLKGKLKRLNYGKVIAEMDANFYVYGRPNVR